MAITSSPERILVLRASGLGDLLTELPAMRGLRSAYNTSHIVGAFPSPLLPLVADCVDEVVDVRAAHSSQGLLALDHYRGPVDLAINLHGKGPQSHRALLRRHPDKLVAYRSEDIAVEGPPWFDHQHEIDRWCDLVNISLTVDADPHDMYLAKEAHRTPGLVVLHPGAGHAVKRWPWQYMANLAQRLHSDGCNVVLTGDESEVDLVSRIRRASTLPLTTELAGRTDMSGLIGLVSEAALVICGDTGVGHLATALKTPSVLLFGPTDPTTWGPRTGPHYVLKGEHMWDITVDEVFKWAHSAIGVCTQDQGACREESLS